ncbi:MAG TPA: DUF533 domain-containing protein [Casimicrobiaceae bacterium]|nr:DUF533 domain-containing protein [Casimicrobiaceae bacterium]
MNQQQMRAVVTIALMSAFADGDKDDRERARIKALSTRLASDGFDFDAIYEEVLLRKPDVAVVAAQLASDRNVAQFAYEIAVGVADADGIHTPAEGEFLQKLAAALKLPPREAKEIVDEADAIVGATDVAPAPVLASANDTTAIDKRILDASITNAALELLPETLASMAILPLQVRMVYRIGQAHGYELDSGHIKEFIATLGIGITGQYLEQFGRKILGGTLGSLLGGMGRTIGRQAASSGMAFATTWAIGQLAKQYYGSGRTLSTDKLKASFTPLVEQGRALIMRYAPAIEERARTIDIRQLPQMISRS